jgi:hypothetical protein
VSEKSRMRKVEVGKRWKTLARRTRNVNTHSERIQGSNGN